MLNDSRQSDVLDFFGWSAGWLSCSIPVVFHHQRQVHFHAHHVCVPAAILEWLATYLLLWPEDGRMKKDEVKGVYDGSIFLRIERRMKEAKGQGKA